MLPKVYIIVVNWNNWRDTLECLESVYRLDYPPFEVVVCDNGSTDDSVSMIAQWAEGLVPAPRSSDPRIRALTDPPVRKPLAVSMLDAPKEGGARDSAIPGSLIVLRLRHNRGYASGNNAGLRFALGRGDGEFFWVLNNDTVVDPGALSALVERAMVDPEVGLCGSMLMLYDDPHRVQAAGGAVYRKWTAIPEIIGAGQLREALPPSEVVERRMSYIVGASMLVSSQFIRDVGPMCEDYFLYFEELDWVMRARGRFKLAFAPKSVVYHKEGATAGSDSNWRTRSVISDLCAVRSRLLITRRFFRLYYPAVFVTIVAALFRRLLRRQPRRAGQVLRILLGPESYRLPLPDPPWSGQSNDDRTIAERRIGAEKKEKRER